jgi:hypothetical protein
VFISFRNSETARRGKCLGTAWDTELASNSESFDREAEARKVKSHIC